MGARPPPPPRRALATGVVLVTFQTPALRRAAVGAVSPGRAVSGAGRCDRTMGTPGCSAAAAGAASGEVRPGRDGGGTLSLPRRPSVPAPQPRPSEGYGPFGQALRSRPGPEGRGGDFRDISVGKGCSQGGESQLPPGRRGGPVPRPQTLEEDRERTGRRPGVAVLGVLRQQQLWLRCLFSELGREISNQD